jgi:hypothetical protein
MMPDNYAIKPSAVMALATWADMLMEQRRAGAMAKVLPEFRARIDRLNAVDTDTFEFDFLRPLQLDR